MKLRHLLPTLLLALSVTLPTFAAATADKNAAAADDPRRTLTITVVEPVDRRPANSEFYNRLAYVFPKVFEARQWPLKIEVERFGANAPDYDLELRIFLQKIREETSGDLTFRAWMNLHDRGTKHDFGIVMHRLYPRAGQHLDDTLDELLRGAAEAAAKKIEDALFSGAAEKE